MSKRYVEGLRPLVEDEALIVHSISNRVSIGPDEIEGLHRMSVADMRTNEEVQVLLPNTALANLRDYANRILGDEFKDTTKLVTITVQGVKITIGG